MGDTIGEKEKDIFHIHFQNKKGIQPKERDRWKVMVHTTTDTYKCDLIGLYETCLNWKRIYTRTKVQQSINNQNKYLNLVIHSQNNAKSHTSLIPGGALLTSTNRWTGRMSKEIHDPEEMGRWLGASYNLGSIIQFKIR